MISTGCVLHVERWRHFRHLKSVRPAEITGGCKWERSSSTTAKSSRCRHPKDCRIEVTGKGLKGEITIHETTGMYRESLMGWGTDRHSLQDALNGVCRRILDRASKEPTEAPCKGMDAFYQELDG